jgi:hypothetical protein
MRRRDGQEEGEGAAEDNSDQGVLQVAGHSATRHEPLLEGQKDALERHLEGLQTEEGDAGSQVGGRCTVGP